MAEGYVQVPPDSTGKMIRAIVLLVGDNTVYMEGCVPYDENGVGLYAATGAGRTALQDVFGAGANITVLNPLFTDPIDKAARLVGIVYGENDQLQQSDPSDAHANPANALEAAGFPHVWDSVTGDWNRAREGTNIGEALVDVADRATRLIGVVYGENAQLQQLTPADGITPNESLEVTGFTHVWDNVAGDWNRVREGANIGELLVDLADRAGRLVGVIYGDAGQVHQVTPADALASGDALSVAGFTFVYNGTTWDMAREGATSGSLLTDLADRAARLLGIVYGNLGQVLQLVPADALAPGNSLNANGFNFVYNGVTWDMVREGSVAGSILTDEVDRAARLLGVVYGSQAQQLQQVAGTFELITQDTGVHTNPEKYLHENHWEPTAEITINVAGAGGEQNVGGAVPAGELRRIKEVTIRHAGTNNTVVTILDATVGNIKISIDVPAQQTITYGSQDGRAIAATLQPVVQSSNVTGGNTFVSLSGIEA